jgi:hypothetical protein
MGLATLVATAYVVGRGSSTAKYPFFALCVWFVVPIGPFTCGLISGLGFWSGLKISRRKASSVVWSVGMSGASVGYSLIYLFWYLQDTTQAGASANLLLFAKFLLNTMPDQRTLFIGKGASDTIPAGVLGFVQFPFCLVGYFFGVLTGIKAEADKRELISGTQETLKGDSLNIDVS